MKRSRFSDHISHGILLTVLAFSACLLTFCFFALKADADPGDAPRPGVICPAKEYSLPEGDNYHFMQELLSLRDYYSDTPFVPDDSLSRSAYYESVYIAEFCDRDNIYPDHPDLVELKDTMYPDAERRVILFFSGNVCNKEDFYRTCIRALAKSSDGDAMLSGDEYKIGASIVCVEDRSVLVIHASSKETVRDLLPEEPVMAYKKEYSYEIPEYYADGGNSRNTEGDRTAPVIYSEEILLPDSGHESFYDLSKYLTGSDDSGNISFHVSPALIGPGYSGNAEVICRDGSGNISSAVLPVNYVSSSLFTAVSGNIFTCSSTVSEDQAGPDDTELHKGTHLILKISDSFSVQWENGLYVYSFKIGGTVLYRVVTCEPYILWNPPGTGVYTVTLEYLPANARTGIMLDSLNISVSDTDPLPFQAPEVRIREGSSLKISDGDILSGLYSGIKVGDIKNSFEVVGSGSSHVITVSSLDSGGNEYAPSENTVVGTGMTLIIYADGCECLRLVSVLYGDVTGDGAIDISDYAKMRFALLGRLSFEGFWLEAANVAGRNEAVFDVSDYAMMRFMLLGRLTIPQ